MSGVLGKLPREIVTHRLALKHFATADARVLSELVSLTIEHLKPWMPWVKHEPMTLAERRNLIDSCERDHDSGTDFHYGMISTEKLIGSIGAHRRIGPTELKSDTGSTGTMLVADTCGKR